MIVARDNNRHFALTNRGPRHLHGWDIAEAERKSRTAESLNEKNATVSAPIALGQVSRALSDSCANLLYLGLNLPCF